MTNLNKESIKCAIITPSIKIDNGVFLLETEEKSKILSIILDIKHLFNQFNSVIEVLFVNKVILINRRNFINLKEEINNYYIIFRQNQLSKIQELISIEGLQVSIENLTEDNESTKKSINNLVNHLSLKYNFPSNDYSKITMNKELKDKIINLFFQQNQNLFLKLSNPISLLNGEYGNFTVRVSNFTSKNYEE